nr:MAG TPA: Superinfection immunity protein [Caudoviricetes sp.]
MIVVIIIGCIYAIPSYVSRGKVRFWQVFWINILLGWTLV